MTVKNEVSVTGTLVWYYYICKREVWLMAHQVNPSRDDANIDLGNFIHENAYRRNTKEVSIGNIKIDIMKRGKNGMVVGEIKKSSRSLESAKMQLLYYLKELEDKGVSAHGEIRIPEEKKVEKVELDDESRVELEHVVRDILRIVYMEKPAKAEKIRFCRNCAYSEFCWS